MQKSENQCDSLTARTRLRTFPVFEVSSFLLVLFILFIKNPDLYLYPALIPDDKLLFVYHFHRFINENNTSSLFYFYANSILLIPNICATGFVAVLPLEWVPRAFAIFSLLVTTAVNWLFCLRPYSVFVSSRLARLMICLLIAMLPIGSWPLQASLLWQSWNFLILIVLLLIIEPVINNRKRLFIIPLIVVSIFSTPGSIIFLPWFLIGAVRLLYERKFLRFFAYALSGASIVIYAFWGMNRLGSYYNEVRLHLGEIIRVGLLTGLPRVMLESFSSLPFRMTIHDISPVIPFLLSMLIFILACIAAYAASKKNPYISGLALFAGYATISMTLLSVIRLPLHDYITFAEKGFRYFYVQKFVMLLFSMICIYQLIAALNRNVKLLVTILAVVLAMRFAVSDQYRFITTEDITYTQYQKQKANFSAPRTIREDGMQLDKCLSASHQMINEMVLKHETIKVDVCFVCHSGNE